jgi:hypothetical protein
MTAIALPHLRKQKKSKPAQAAATAVKVWTAVKVTTMAAKTAKKGHASFKTAKRGAKFLVVPLAAGGGFVALKKFRSSSSGDEPATPYGSPVGPVATPATVTPPKTAPGSNATVNGEVGDTTTPATGPESTSAS